MGLKTVVDVIKEVDKMQGNLGEWVANGSPSNSIAQGIQKRYRDACDQWSNGGQWTTALSATGRRTMSNICGDWLQSNGSGDPYQEQLFEGLQCDCARYDLDINVGYVQEGRNEAFGITQVRVRGPVQYIRVKVYSPSTYTVELSAKGAQFQNSSSWPSCGQQQYYSTTISRAGPDVVSARIESITVTAAPDGDDCGSLPPETKPNPNPRPNPGLPDTDLPFQDDDGNVRLPLPPTLDPFGEVIELPSFPVPDIFSEESEGEGGYDETAPVEEGEPVEDTSDSSDSEPREVCFDPPPDGHIWIGYALEISGLPKTVSGHIPQSGDDLTVYPRIVGSHYPVFEVGEDKSVGTPMNLASRLTMYVVPIAGLALACVRWFCVYPEVTVKITPFSQPRSDLFTTNEEE